MDSWAKTDPEPVAGEFRSRKKEIEEWRARFDARSAELAAERPDSVPAVLARPLIRAVQMAKYAQWLHTADDYEQVMATEVDLGGEAPMTVQQTIDLYHLDELPDAAFEDAGNYTGINSALMQQQLTSLVQILGQHG